MKTCFKCSQSKPRSEFYAHPRMSDGLLGKCKDCTRADSIANAHRDIEKTREKDRERYQRVPAPTRILWQKAQRERSPEKYKARRDVSNALRSGRIARPENCEDCGKSTTTEAHHEDYSKPLDVTWLCFVCHRKRHGQFKEVA